MTYSKIDPASHDTVSSVLDLLKPPETITSVLDTGDRDVNPIGEVNSPQLEFEFRTSSFKYWNVEKTRLLIQGKVVLADGSNLADADTCTITPTTNLLHSFIQSITLSIDGADASHEANYPYAAYLETLISRSAGYKRTISETSLWIEDDAGRIDRADITNAHTKALKRRKEIISGSRTFEVCDNLHIPFLHQERYGLCNSTVKIQLNRSSDKFCLLSTDGGDNNDYKVVITRAVLIINEVDVNPSIINAHSALMAAGKTAMYPLNQVETQMFTISAGKLSDRIVIKTNQQLPKRITFAFVDHEAKNGSLTKDPFKFLHCDVKRMSLDVDGRPFPHKPLETNFPDGLCAQAYFNLAMATGRLYGDVSHGITMKQFKNGYTLFMFDLTPDGCHGAGVHLIKHGSLTLDVTFGTALPNTVSLFAYLERDELIQIDNERVLTKLPRI